MNAQTWMYPTFFETSVSTYPYRIVYLYPNCISVHALLRWFTNQILEVKVFPSLIKMHSKQTHKQISHIFFSPPKHWFAQIDNKIYDTSLRSINLSRAWEFVNHKLTLEQLLSTDSLTQLESRIELAGHINPKITITTYNKQSK